MALWSLKLCCNVQRAKVSRKILLLLVAFAKTLNNVNELKKQQFKVTTIDMKLK